MDSAFLQDRITATKAQIIAWENAATAIASNQMQSYSMDTGQSKQTVTKSNLKTLDDGIAGLYNRLATLCARRNGTGSKTARAGW